MQKRKEKKRKERKRKEIFATIQYKAKYHTGLPRYNLFKLCVGVLSAVGLYSFTVSVTGNTLTVGLSFCMP